MKRLLLSITLIINGAAFAAAPARTTTTTTAAAPVAPSAKTLREIAIDRVIQGLDNNEFTLDQINPNSDVPGTKLPANLFEEVKQAFELPAQYRELVNQYPELVFIGTFVDRPTREEIAKFIELKKDPLLLIKAQRYALRNRLSEVINSPRFSDVGAIIAEKLIEYGININRLSNEDQTVLLRSILKFNDTSRSLAESWKNKSLARLNFSFGDVAKKILSQATVIIPEDINSSTIILLPNFPEILQIMKTKGLNLRNTRFVKDILEVISYLETGSNINIDNMSLAEFITSNDYDILLTNLQALLAAGAPLPSTIYVMGNEANPRKALQAAYDSLNDPDNNTDDMIINQESPLAALIKRMLAQRNAIAQALKIISEAEVRALPPVLPIRTSTSIGLPPAPRDHEGAPRIPPFRKPE